MKKVIHKLTAVTLLFAICLSFSSCLIFEKKRGNVGYYYNDSGTKVSFKDKTYMMIEDVPHYFESYSLNDYGYVLKNENDIFKSELHEDVLVLNYSDDDPRLICVGDKYYCLDELHNYAKELIQTANFTDYCIQLWDEDKGEYYESTLDAGVIHKIKEIVSSGTPTMNYPTAEDTVTIKKCDEKRLFMYTEYYVEKTIYGKYLISVNHSENVDEEGTYIVSEKDGHIFSPLFKEETNQGGMVLRW